MLSFVAQLCVHHNQSINARLYVVKYVLILDKVEKFRRELANEENLLKNLRMSNNRST